MTERMRLAMLDDEIEQVGRLTGADRHAAGVALALRELGCGPEGILSAAVQGRDLTLFVVRDQTGALQVESVAIARERWR